MGSRWLGIAGFLFVLTLLVINTYLLVPGASSRLTRLESDINSHSSTLTKLESPLSASDQLSENLDYLNTRVHMLTNFVTDLEVKLTSLKALTASMDGCEPQLKADAAAHEVLAVTNQSDADTALSAPATFANPELQADAQAPADEVKEPTAAAQVASPPAPTEMTDQGSWVINLASLDNQAAADRFSARAQARGIPVQQQMVSLKGTQRWRIRVTGFATLTEARINAGPIKEKLGLQEVWISQR
jgi:hypothetical protein